MRCPGPKTRSEHPEASHCEQTPGALLEQARTAPGAVIAIRPRREALASTTWTRIVARSTEPPAGTVIPALPIEMLTSFEPDAAQVVTPWALSTQPPEPPGTKASLPGRIVAHSGSSQPNVTVIGPLSLAGTGSTPSWGAAVAGVSLLVLLIETTTSTRSPTSSAPQSVGNRDR